MSLTDLKRTRLKTSERTFGTQPWIMKWKPWSEPAEGAEPKKFQQRNATQNPSWWHIICEQSFCLGSSDLRRTKKLRTWYWLKGTLVTHLCTWWKTALWTASCRRWHTISSNSHADLFRSAQTQVNSSNRKPGKAFAKVLVQINRKHHLHINRATH